MRVVVPQEELIADGNKARAHVYITAPPSRDCALEGDLCWTNDAQVGGAVHEHFEGSIEGELRMEHTDPTTVHQDGLLQQN
eukprot:scaffold64592_cov63-Phaeocystis_antarctica.AAC.3